MKWSVNQLTDKSIGVGGMNVSTLKENLTKLKKKTFGGTQLLSKSQQICEKVNHFLCFGLFQTISLKSFNVIRLCVWVFYHHICIYYLQYIQYSEFLKAHCVRLCFDEFQTLIHNHYFI